jgi:hypothetical protein
MSNKLKMLAIAAAVAATTSSAAMAQCPPGYGLYAGVCQPMAPMTAEPAPGAYAPNNPVSGAATGAAAGAAAGGAAAGPVGAVVGGALGTATGAVAGTTNMVTGAPVVAYGSSVPPRAAAPAVICEPGYTLYSERCYPAR